MTGKERVINAFSHKESDFVPVSDQLIVSKVASEILGRYAYTGGGEFSKDTIELLYKGERDFLVEKYVEDTLEIHEKLGLDFIRVGTVPSKNYSQEDLPKKIKENTYLYENKETKNWSIYKFSPSSGQFFCVSSSYEKEGFNALEREIKYIEKKFEEKIEFDDKSIFEGWDKIVEKVIKMGQFIVLKFLENFLCQDIKKYLKFVRILDFSMFIEAMGIQDLYGIYGFQKLDLMDMEK